MARPCRGRSVAGAMAVALVLAGCGSRPALPVGDAAADGPADAAADVGALDVAADDGTYDGSPGDGPRGDGQPADRAFDAATATEILAFCDEEARAVCGLRRACQIESSEDRCASERAKRCRAGAVDALIPGVAAGRVQFDAAEAARWLASLETAACNRDVDQPPAFFRGSLPDGAPCVDPRECTGRICDRSKACPGLCGSPAAVGGSCEPFGCDGSTAWCSADKCLATRPVGSLCGAPGGCGELAYCAINGRLCENSAPCTCVPYGAAGQSCKDTDRCLPGLGCAQGKCRPPGQKGEWCDWERRTGCASGLTCLYDEVARAPATGLCGDPVAEGGSCFIDECARGLFCVHVPTSVTVVKGVCQRPAAMGQPCPGDTPCVAGTYCGRGRTCVAGAALGEPCLLAKLVPDADVPGDDCNAIENQCRVIRPPCAGEGITCSNSQGGTCVVVPTAGELCSGLCAGDLICEFEGMGILRCRERRAPGQKCAADFHCASGTCSREVCAPPCTSADL